MRILQDIFPAVISMTSTQPTAEAPLTASNPATTLSARTMTRARVITTDERIIVAMDSPTGPQVIFNQPYSEATYERGSNQKVDTFLTTDQDSPIYVAYRRDEDCSCGSRLRGWQPFGVLHSTNSIKD